MIIDCLKDVAVCEQEVAVESASKVDADGDAPCNISKNDLA